MTKRMLERERPWRELATRFLSNSKTYHPYKDYASLIFCAFDGGRNSADASHLLSQRWKEIEPGKATWPAR